MSTYRSSLRRCYRFTTPMYIRHSTQRNEVLRLARTDNESQSQDKWARKIEESITRWSSDSCREFYNSVGGRHLQVGIDTFYTDIGDAVMVVTPTGWAEPLMSISTDHRSEGTMYVLQDSVGAVLMRDITGSNITLKLIEALPTLMEHGGVYDRRQETRK